MNEPELRPLPRVHAPVTVTQVRSACRDLPPPGHLAYGSVDLPNAAASVVPIVDQDGHAAVVLTKRPATMTHHRNDWVFPGGRVDVAGHELPIDAARREVNEELGVPTDAIEIIGQLNTHGPIATGYVIDVFVGLVADSTLINADPREVADVEIARLADLAAPGVHRRSYEMLEHETGPIAAGFTGNLAGGREPLHYFEIRSREWVWGTQGTILYEFLMHVLSV